MLVENVPELDRDLQPVERVDLRLLMIRRLGGHITGLQPGYGKAADGPLINCSGERGFCERGLL